ncbi:hypothetical protein [Pelagibacterium sp.]|uniref:hypothetical protein n=1 Tax=Pelagibacterium sp. TaxID=1967288 RepID=UPI003A95BE45
MKKDWYWHYGAMIGAVIGGTGYMLFVMNGVPADDAGAFRSPTTAVAGGAFWGVAIVWIRNKLANRKI